MITILESQIPNTDLSGWSSIRHGAACANVRLRSQHPLRSSPLNRGSRTHNGLGMRRNVTDQCNQWPQLPSPVSSVVLNSP